jgi:hypothetical protein
MDPVADVIAGLSLLVSGVAFWLGRREAGERAKWESEQERKHVVFTQPDLVPVGSALGIEGDNIPQRLALREDQRIQLHNQGGSIPSDVRAVLFPAAIELRPDVPVQARTEELYGTYWEGTLDVPPDAGGRGDFVLYKRSFPLRGSHTVIAGHMLFAPPLPQSGTSVSGQHHYYFGRLTLTLCDRNGRKLAAVYNGESVVKNNALTQDWVRVAGPSEVEHDLRELAERARGERQPPIYGDER